MKVDIDGLADAINEALSDMSTEVEENMKKGFRKIARDAAKDLKNNPIIPERTGDYKKSFYVKKRKEGQGYIRLAVANKKYQIAHLLEDGHLTRNGTDRTEKFPHWKETQKVVDEKVDELKRNLLGG